MVIRGKLKGDPEGKTKGKIKGRYYTLIFPLILLHLMVPPRDLQFISVACTSNKLIDPPLACDPITPYSFSIKILPPTVDEAKSPFESVM